MRADRAAARGCVVTRRCEVTLYRRDGSTFAFETFTLRGAVTHAFRVYRAKANDAARVEIRDPSGDLVGILGAPRPARDHWIARLTRLDRAGKLPIRRDKKSR